MISHCYYETATSLKLHKIVMVLVSERLPQCKGNKYTLWHKGSPSDIVIEVTSFVSKNK